MRNRSSELMTSIFVLTKPETICEFIEKYKSEIDFNLKDNNENTFLHTLTMNSYSENDKIKILKSLLSKSDLEKSGIDANAKNRDGFTALDYAAQKHDFHTINLLLRCGAKIAESKDIKKLIITVEIVRSPYPDLKKRTRISYFSSGISFQNNGCYNRDL